MQALSSAGFQVVSVGNIETALRPQGKQTARIRQTLKDAGFQVVGAEDTEIGCSVISEMPPCLVVIADDSIEWRRLCLDAVDISHEIHPNGVHKE